MARGRYAESTAVKVLRALVAFANGDTEDPLLRDLVTGHAGEAGIMTSVVRAEHKLTPAGRRALQGELRAFLRLLGNGASTEAYAAKTRVHVELVPVKTGNTVWLLVDGTPRDVLLYQVATFLQAVGVERLHLCPAPDCDRVFIKIGRREYCSERCQRRVFVSTYDPFKAKPRRKDGPHARTTRTR